MVLATSNGCASKTEVYRQARVSNKFRVWCHASLVVLPRSRSSSGNRSRALLEKDDDVCIDVPAPMLCAGCECEAAEECPTEGGM